MLFDRLCIGSRGVHNYRGKASQKIPRARCFISPFTILSSLISRELSIQSVPNLYSHVLSYVGELYVIFGITSHPQSRAKKEKRMMMNYRIARKFFTLSRKVPRARGCFSRFTIILSLISRDSKVFTTCTPMFSHV